MVFEINRLARLLANKVRGPRKPAEQCKLTELRLSGAIGLSYLELRMALPPKSPATRRMPPLRRRACPRRASTAKRLCRLLRMISKPGVFDVGAHAFRGAPRGVSTCRPHAKWDHSLLAPVSLWLGMYATEEAEPAKASRGALQLAVWYPRCAMFSAEVDARCSCQSRQSQG